MCGWRKTGLPADSRKYEDMLFFKKKGPLVRERKDHCISRSNIDPDALKVLYRLSGAGYTAYLVGGSVRDLLLGRHPKDFDVGTDARPNDIRRIFRNCFLIGRRFRLAHVIFGKKVIETSTFRAQPRDVGSENGLYQTEDNTFGTPEEDAKRRDFTVNGLFYDIKTFSVIDYVDGLRDLEKKVLRCIGDPNVRFREDPVRMMRAVKFAARLGFEIDRASRKAIQKHHADIKNAAIPRVCEEVYRLFTYRSSAVAFRLLWQFELLRDLLPELAAHIDSAGGEKSSIWRYLAAFDADDDNEQATNGLRTAVLCYDLYCTRLEEWQAREREHASHGHSSPPQHLSHTIVGYFSEHLKIPKVAFFKACSILDMQRRFAEMPKRGRANRVVAHPDFLEALTLRRIVLQVEGGERAVLDAWKALYDELRHERRSARSSGSNFVVEVVHEGEDAALPPDDAEMTQNGSRRRRPRRHRRNRTAAAQSATAPQTEGASVDPQPTASQ